MDRNGNQARLFYENGTGPLQFVNDSVGRLLRVRRHGDGRIAAFEVKNASARGAWTSFRTYEYNERGDLVAARDALGHATTFAYDEDHRLVLERWPTGLEVHYRYDSHGRCVETWCNDPNERALLAEGVPEVLADGSRACTRWRAQASGPRRSPRRPRKADRPSTSGLQRQGHRWIERDSRPARGTLHPWTTRAGSTWRGTERSSRPIGRQGATIIRMRRSSAAPIAWPG